MSILSIAVLLLDLWALYQLLQSSANGASKLLWAALILLMPLVGVILWYLLGPKMEIATPATE